MDAPPPPTAGALSGVVPGVLVVATLLLGLQIAGLEPLVAYAPAIVSGVATTVVLCRRRAGARAAVGLAVTLTVVYSMLASVLVAFVVAVLGV